MAETIVNLHCNILLIYHIKACNYTRNNLIRKSDFLVFPFNILNDALFPPKYLLILQRVKPLLVNLLFLNLQGNIDN